MSIDTVTPQDELRFAIHEALDIAEKVRRDPQRDQAGRAMPPGQPTLARLRGGGASTVKNWMWSLLYRERIKYEGTPSILADRIVNTFKHAIRQLEADAETYQGDSALRIDAVIDAFKDSMERIEKAQQAIEDERLRQEQERQQRFARDRTRASKIDARSKVIEYTYDLADHFDVEHDGRADIGNEDLRKILLKVADHLPNDELRLKANEAAGDIWPAGKYSAWTKLYDIANYLERGDEDAV